MKILLSAMCAMMLMLTGCGEFSDSNETLGDEQQHTEKNQRHLNEVQPPPYVNGSLERDNLTKRFMLMNDRSVQMYMYVFIEGVGSPIGYYLVNKVSSVNSQLTNPMQVVDGEEIVGGREGNGIIPLPSPAEDGSYGTNGDGVFGFTPDGLYVEHNMKYIVSTAPLKFKDVPFIGEISVDLSKKLQSKLKDIEGEVYKK